MKSRRVKMSLEEYHRRPFSLGWKQEYFDGCLVETPRELVVHATLPVVPRLISSQVPLRCVVESDEQALFSCFEAAFEDTIEFCDYTAERLAEGARKSLHHFFHGSFHRCLPASRVALGPPGTPEAGLPIGAALVLAQDEDWALLDMIFVTRAWQHRGIGSALAAAALTALHELGGFQTLVSRYYLGNEPSRAWHGRFGFSDEADLFLAKLYLRAAEHELRRGRELGLTPKLENKLTDDCAHWENEVKRLESLFEQGREEECIPWRKWRCKRSES